MTQYSLLCIRCLSIVDFAALERLNGWLTLCFQPVRLLPKTWTQYFENELTDSDANWQQWCPGVMPWNDQLLKSIGQKSRSIRSIKLNPFRGVAAFLVQYCMELDYREYVIFIECYFLTVHWCVYHVETTGRINCVFYIVNRNVRNTEKYCKNYSVLIF